MFKRLIKKIFTKVFDLVIEEEQRKIIESLQEEFKRRIVGIINQALAQLDSEIKERIKTVEEQSQEELRKFLSTIQEEINTAISQIFKSFAEIDQERIRRASRIRGDRVKIIIDGENFRGVKTYLKNLGKEVEAVEIIETIRKRFAEEEGVKIICYDSFDPYIRSLPEEWEAFRESGIELRTIPRKLIVGERELRKKSLVDSFVLVELMKTILEDEYGVIILFAGDSDYAPAVKELKRWGIKLTVAHSRKYLSLELKSLADVIYLDEIY